MSSKKAAAMVALFLIVVIVSPVSVFGAGAAEEEEVPRFMSIATATTAGIFYPLGTSLAATLNDHFDRPRFSVEATGGSGQNIELLRTGEVDLAFVSNDAVVQAVNEGRADHMLGITRIYSNDLQIVVRSDSGIQSVEDLVGRRISVGAPGSGHEATSRILFEAYGIDIDNDIEAEYLGVSETTDQIRDGMIQGAILTHATPSAAIMELYVTVDVRHISLSVEKAEEIAQLPALGVVTIPADSYPGLDSDITTVANHPHLYTTQDVSDDLVYDITRTIFENLSTLREEYSVWNSTTLERAAEGLPTPFHPGARRYLEEQGIVLD